METIFSLYLPLLGEVPTVLLVPPPDPPDPDFPPDFLGHGPHPQDLQRHSPPEPPSFSSFLGGHLHGRPAGI